MSDNAVKIDKRIIITGIESFVESARKKGIENPAPWYSNNMGDEFTAMYDYGDSVTVAPGNHMFVQKGDFREASSC